MARWTSVAELPEPISNNAVASVVADDGTTTIYSMMGITDPGDPATITPACYRVVVEPGGDWGAWERIADAPLWDGRARIAANAVAVGGRVFLLGGYTVAEDGTETTDPRLFEFLPSENRFVQRARVPVEVDDAVAGAWGDDAIVLVSGWHGPDHDNTRAVQVYLVGEDRWLAATPIPTPGVFGHAGTVVGDRVVAVDGVAVEPTADGRRFVLADTVVVGQLDRADPGRIDWHELAAHPGRATYRGAMSQGSIGSGAVLLVGGADRPYNIDGTGYDGSAGEPLGQVLMFDPAQERWSSLTIAGTPASMDHRGLVRVGGTGWALIGGMVEPGRATRRCWLLAFATLCSPSSEPRGR